MMKYFMPLFLVLALSPSLSLAGPSPSPSGYPISQVASSSPQVGGVAEPAAPPAWAQDLMVAAQKLPVIGPVVSKALLYAGILGSILTMLCAFLMSAMSLIAGAFNYAGVAKIAQAITDFKNGKLMYWIKFFSFFNAKKPDPQ